MRLERATQNRVISLFKDKLNYRYLGNLAYEENLNLRETDIKAWLVRSGYSRSAITNAINYIKRAVTLTPIGDLYIVNKEVYSLLRYGFSVEDPESSSIARPTIRLIDWQNPLNNDFAIAEEVTIVGVNNKRPDLVIYVNGIALGVIELKRAGVSVSEGIRQNLDNQQASYIRPFFSTIQTVLAGNDSQGLFYGTIKTPEKFFLKWKEDQHTYNNNENLLDQQLVQFCEKTRYLELIHDFVVFEGGIKKLCRPNQYFGIKSAQKFINQRKGGIIWHTQGSGKSLTMLWLAQWIRENQTDARVLIITDRTELDDNILSLFAECNLNIEQATSGNNLLQILNASSPPIISSLIHKFGNHHRQQNSQEIDIDRLLASIDQNNSFSPKGNLFVFIDECHRTQSGELHKGMKKLLPNALFIGFTGTPLLKTEKQTSREIFGEYIHTYKFDEAVKDGVVLDLLYEARDIDQNITNQTIIDLWFDSKTNNMNDYAKTLLKRKWCTMSNLMSAQSRLEKIAIDIISDFTIKPRLKDGTGNAMLVTSSILEACKYYEIFQRFGFRECAIISSFNPSIHATRGETTGDGTTDRVKQSETYNRMLNGQDPIHFETSIRDKFVKEPNQMKLLIVVDKLLTGFDAPSCTYLYIDKEMRDHGLFQAICRVNRTEKESKDFGYIIDYKNLFKNLNTSMKQYTSDAFDNFDQEDIKDLLNNRLEKSKKTLDEAIETLHNLTLAVKAPKEFEQYREYFCGDINDTNLNVKEYEERRKGFYGAVIKLIYAYNNIAGEMQEAGYKDIDAEEIKKKVNAYIELRQSIKLASGDYIDLKQYEPDMRQLLDMYLIADPSKTISNLGDATLLEILAKDGQEAMTHRLPQQIKNNPTSVAETIEANVRRVITQEQNLNPAHYDKMSQLLQDLILKRKSNALAYEKYLQEMENLVKKLDPNSQTYPESINTLGKKSIYAILDENEQLTNQVHQAIMNSKERDWHNDMMKCRQIKHAIEEYLTNQEKLNQILNTIKYQPEYR